MSAFTHKILIQYTPGDLPYGQYIIVAIPNRATVHSVYATEINNDATER